MLEALHIEMIFKIVRALLRTSVLVAMIISALTAAHVSAAETTPVHAGYGGIAGYQLPIWINKETGIGRKYGIDLVPL